MYMFIISIFFMSLVNVLGILFLFIDFVYIFIYFTGENTLYFGDFEEFLCKHHPDATNY